jgi:hypothetical protein
MANDGAAGSKMSVNVKDQLASSAAKRLVVFASPSRRGEA